MKGPGDDAFFSSLVNAYMFETVWREKLINGTKYVLIEKDNQKSPENSARCSVKVP